MAQEPYHVHISAKHHLFDLKLSEVWRYRELILLFTKRTFKVQYAQTVLGPLWILLNPLLTSIIYVILFGNIAKLGTDGVPQLLFYLSGHALWTCFSSGVTKNATVFRDNSRLFGKVYFPRLTVPIATILSSEIRFLIQMIPVAGMMIYYTIKGILHPGIEIILLPFIMIWLGVLSVGIGIIISSVTTKYRDLSVLVDFGIHLWMYATPVVYPLSTVSGKLRTVLLINPVTVPMELFRHILFGTKFSCISYLPLSILISVLAFFLGLIVFNKVERTFMDTV